MAKQNRNQFEEDQPEELQELFVVTPGLGEPDFGIYKHTDGKLRLVERNGAWRIVDRSAALRWIAAHEHAKDTSSNDDAREWFDLELATLCDLLKT